MHLQYGMKQSAEFVFRDCDPGPALLLMLDYEEIPAPFHLQRMQACSYPEVARDAASP